MHERRREMRVALSNADRPGLFVLDAQRRRVPLTAVSLSRKGIGFLTSKHFATGQELEATVVLPGTIFIAGRGTIRYGQSFAGLMNYGMELDLDEDSQYALAQYVETASHAS